MASPVGHSIAGIIGWVLSGDFRKERGYSLLPYYLFAANAADLDFIPGILLGEPGMFHHGVTHSIGAMAVFGLLLFAVYRIDSRYLRASIVALILVYGSHLLIDWLTVDFVPPIGATFLWPFSSDYWISPFPMFLHVERRRCWEWPVLIHNLKACLLECLWLTPLLGLAVYRATKGGTATNGKRDADAAFHSSR